MTPAGVTAGARSLALAATLALAGCLNGAPSGPGAALSGPVRYQCADGTALVVDYQPGEDPPALTLDIDGPETLLLEPGDGTRQRWSWPSDGSYHIWELADGVGTLRYRDGEAGTTALVRANCRAS